MNRNFKTSRFFTPGMADHQTIHYFDPENDISHFIRGNTYETDSAVIHTDGACYNNGYPNARASYGVFFGPDSYYNSADEIYHDSPTGHSITSQYAEIFAAYTALKIVKDRRNEHPFKNLTAVVVNTDSKYVVDAVTEWMINWRNNGWRDYNGRQLKNGMMFQRLDGMANMLESNGIRVLFRWIPRRMNEDADLLAEEALRG